MSNFDRNLDAWITGENDPNAPFNQPDSEPDISITDLMEELEYDKAFSKMAEVREDLRRLENVIKMITNDKGETKNVYLLNRLKAIRQKI